MYEYTNYDDVVVIRLVGELSLENADDFKKWVINQFINQGTRKIVLDMSELEGLDSYALGELVIIYKIILNVNGHFIVISPNSNIKRLFFVSGLEKIIKTYETLSEALGELK